METPDDTSVVPLKLRERSPNLKLETLRDPVLLVGSPLHTMTTFRGEDNLY